MNRSAPSLLLLTALSLGLFGPVARAQGTPDANQERAKELYQNGSLLYDEGRYEDAIIAFQEAYRLSEQPKLLYNIAQAQERLGRYQEALDTLSRYRAYAPAEEREALDRRIRNLERRLEEQGTSTPPAPTATERPAPAPTPGGDTGKCLCRSVSRSYPLVVFGSFARYPQPYRLDGTYGAVCDILGRDDARLLPLRETARRLRLLHGRHGSRRDRDPVCPFRHGDCRSGDGTDPWGEAMTLCRPIESWTNALTAMIVGDAAAKLAASAPVDSGYVVVLPVFHWVQAAVNVVALYVLHGAAQRHQAVHGVGLGLTVDQVVTVDPRQQDVGAWFFTSCHESAQETLGRLVEAGERARWEALMQAEPLALAAVKHAEYALSCSVFGDRTSRHLVDAESLLAISHALVFGVCNDDKTVRGLSSAERIIEKSLRPGCFRGVDPLRYLWKNLVRDADPLLRAKVDDPRFGALVRRVNVVRLALTTGSIPEAETVPFRDVDVLGVSA